MIKFFLWSSCILSTMVVCAQSPLMVCLILLMMAFSVSFMVLWSLLPWASMGLILIFIGGMMILFIYITALSHNVKFFISGKMFFVALGGSIFIFASGPVLTSKPQNVSMSEFFSMISSPTSFLMFALLMVALLTVVKASQSFKGSLIQFAL